jgi:hypothetical protein
LYLNFSSIPREAGDGKQKVVAIHQEQNTLHGASPFRTILASFAPAALPKRFQWLKIGG